MNKDYSLDKDEMIRWMQAIVANPEGAERILDTAVPLFTMECVYEKHPEFLPKDEREFQEYAARQKKLGSKDHLEWFLKEVMAEDVIARLNTSLNKGTTETYIADAIKLRKTAMGMTLAQLDRLQHTVKTESEASPLRKRYCFETIKFFMLQRFISTNGATEPVELVAILRKERAPGKPAPIPAWYKEVWACPFAVMIWDTCSARTLAVVVLKRSTRNFPFAASVKWPPIAPETARLPTGRISTRNAARLSERDAKRWNRGTWDKMHINDNGIMRKGSLLKGEDSDHTRLKDCRNCH